MASEYFIQPAGDMSQGLSGLGSILQQNAERKELKATEEKARKEQQEMQTAVLDAWQSGDPSKMAEAGFKYPQISQMAAKGLGMMEDYQKQEGTDFAISVLSNPDEAQALTERRLQLLTMNNPNGAKRDPTHTLGFYTALMNGKRDEALGGLEMHLAALNPDAYKAYQATKKEEDGAEPAAMQTLRTRAEESGLVPGTADYQEFMKTGGNALRAGASAVTRAYDNGTVLKVLPDGSTEVTTPDGNAVIGQARVDALRKAREEQVDFAAAKAGATARASGDEKRIQDTIDLGMDAAQGAPTLRRAIDLLGEVETGGFDGAKIKAKQWLGVESADEGELSNNLGAAVLSQLKATFGSAFTEKEGARLERISAGLTKSPAANKRLLQQALSIVERSANRAIEAAYEAGDERTAHSIEDLLDFTLTDEGGQEMPKSASDNGVTADMWGLFTPEEKAAFK